MAQNELDDDTDDDEELEYSRYNIKKKFINTQ